MAQNTRVRRIARVRRAVRAASHGRLRLSVFRSSKNIYAQVIDTRRVTLAAASSREDLAGRAEGKGKTAVSTAVGKLLAERAKQSGVEKVCFDRGGYLYHGRVKALADGAREGGLSF